MTNMRPALTTIMRTIGFLSIPRISSDLGSLKNSSLLVGTSWRGYARDGVVDGASASLPGARYWTCVVVLVKVMKSCEGSAAVSYRLKTYRRVRIVGRVDCEVVCALGEVGTDPLVALAPWRDD